jgi:uncharacterized caspase-like protein
MQLKARRPVRDARGGNNHRLDHSITMLLATLLLLLMAMPSFGQRGLLRGLIRPQRGPTNRPLADEPAATPVGHLPRRWADQAGNQQFALVIAVREYPQAGQLASLPGTERDALRLAAALRNGGYAESNIVLVYDDAEQPALRPTRANILAQLRALLGRAQEPDSVLVFFTGHGVALAASSYLCPSDATDAALGNPQLAVEHLISVQEVATQLSKQCKASHKLMVVDACRDTTNDRTRNYVQNVADLESPAEGVWLMSSCSNGQFSWMSDRVETGQRHALFSYYLAEGLEGAADLLGDNDGRVGLFELYTYAFVKTNQAARAINQLQTPELFGLGSPFTLVTTGSFVARGKLTTSDPAWEAQRSATQLADDVVLNLRAADAEYRATIAADNATRDIILQATEILQRYLCHLLGNRIEAALELDEDCRRAHLAQGLCYRTCGMYEEALAGFLRGGENFDLFVKTKPDDKKHYIAHDESGEMLRYTDGNPVPRIEGQGVREPSGMVALVAAPGDTQVQHEVARKSLVRIQKIDGPWMFVSAVNDQEITPGGWIHQDELHWFPEAVDLYTPSSPMRPWGSGSGANRLDYAANGLNNLADQLAEPARRLEQVAIPFDNAANRIIDAANRAGQPIGRANALLDAAGRFGAPVPVIPNPVAVPAGWAAYFARLPANWIHHAARYARIPSNYVAMAGGYAAVPGSYARTAQFWAGAANDYYDGHAQAEKQDSQRQEFLAAGELEPVEKRPVMVVESPWSKKRSRGPGE